MKEEFKNYEKELTLRDRRVIEYKLSHCFHSADNERKYFIYDLLSEGLGFNQILDIYKAY